MRLTNLDMDVLRTFVTGTELGSFAKAATRLGRSQSAISLQLKRLEEQVGESLFRKEGAGKVHAFDRKRRRATQKGAVTD